MGLDLHYVGVSIFYNFRVSLSFADHCSALWTLLQLHFAVLRLPIIGHEHPIVHGPRFNVVLALHQVNELGIRFILISEADIERFIIWAADAAYRRTRIAAETQARMFAL